MASGNRKETDPLSVLHLGRFYPGAGGVEAHVVSLLRGLNQEIKADDLVAGPRNDSVLDSSGFRVYFARSLGTFASTAVAPTFPFLLRRLASQYDIVHIHLPDPLSVFASLLLPSSIPLVATWHSDVVRQKRLLRIYQPFVDRLLKRLQFLIAPTPKHFESSTQIDACEESHRRVIPFGVEEERLRITPVVRARMNYWKRTAGNRKLLLAVGRHVYYKGFEFLVQAMKSVNSDALLVLAGAGPLTETYRSIARRLEVEDRILFPGRISDEDLAALMHTCDIFCMPSVEPSEAFGLVQLDAMACGKPVICCELNNGVTYVNLHEKTGLVVPPCDVPALAAAIHRLLIDDALRQKLGAEARRRTLKEFRYDDMIEKTLNLYRELLR